MLVGYSPLQWYTLLLHISQGALPCIGACAVGYATLDTAQNMTVQGKRESNFMWYHTHHKTVQYPNPEQVSTYSNKSTDKYETELKFYRRNQVKTRQTAMDPARLLEEHRTSVV